MAKDPEKAVGETTCFASSSTREGTALVSRSRSSPWMSYDWDPGACVNFLLEGVYSHCRSFASHRLHRGRSPEHLVLWV